MDGLLLYAGKPNDQEKFDPTKLTKDLQETPGTYDINATSFGTAAVGCSYDFNGDSTDLHLDKNLEVIAIHGKGDASLQLALELQKRDRRSLRVANYSYAFDLPLQHIKSVEDFKEKIAEAYRTEDVFVV